MSSVTSPEDLHQIEYLLGPWLIGSFVDLLLQGVLFCQFAHYFELYSDDKWNIKLAVIGLMLVTTLKSIQAFSLAWIQNILYFEDLKGAILLSYTAWWQSGNPLMVECIGIYVQTFFLHRLYRISGNKWWVVAPIALLIAFAFCSICLGTYYITLGAAYSPEISLWFATHLSSVCAADLLVTLSIAFFLIRSKRDVLPQTYTVIDSLVKLTLSTAAPASICAMLNLIFSQLYSGQNVLISTAFNQALPKLYGMSMMWTLNARRNIRAARQPVHMSGNSLRRPQNDVELDSYGVHIHTETSTQQTDIRGMFRHDEKKTFDSEGETFQGHGMPDYKSTQSVPDYKSTQSVPASYEAVVV